MKRILFLILTVLAFASCKQTDSTTTTTVTKYIGCTKVLENQGSCIRWMDRVLYFAYSTGSNANSNNQFQKTTVKETLTEIATNTMLGTGYWTYNEVDESLLNPILSAGLSESEYKSFILVWDDTKFNDFLVNSVGGNVPDTNAVTVINAAHKRKFYIIVKASCFTSSASCNGITTTGVKALIARQIGFLSGLSPVSCSSDPSNVMCATLPIDDQWSTSNKNKWFASVNGMLEVIYNNPNYYDEYVPSTSSLSDNTLALMDNMSVEHVNYIKDSLILEFDPSTGKFTKKF